MQFKNVNKSVYSLHGNHLTSYEATPAVWDHAVHTAIPDVNALTLTPARQASTQLPQRDKRLS